MSLVLQNVSKRYANGHLALDNVNLTLEPREFAFLTGHSGAGKSTLLKLVTAMERPTAGQMTVCGESIDRLKPRHIPGFRRRIGIILQTPELLPDKTALENAALPLIIAGLPRHEVRNRARSALAKIGLKHRLDHFPHELSVGEQQRVSIARAIVSKPSLLPADEPTGSLDPTLAEEIMHLFQQFNQLVMSILIASHDLSLIQRRQHRVITLHHGKLLC